MSRQTEGSAVEWRSAMDAAFWLTIAQRFEIKLDSTHLVTNAPDDHTEANRNQSDI